MSLKVEQQHREAVVMEHPGALDQDQPVGADAMHEDDGAS